MLKLITNDAFKKSLPTKCKVQINGEVETFTDFVTVGYNDESGETTIMRNTDAVTLGKALVMIQMAYNESIVGLSDSDMKDIKAAILEA